MNISDRSLGGILIKEDPRQIKLEFDHYIKKAIILCGPTASGKTEMSLYLAKALGGEIISADSMQVYKQMDLGTAKATEEERAQAPHHLIDICDLTQGFNVVEFYTLAIEAMRSIFARNKVPIIVGGTGFYVNALLYGPPQGPPSDEHVRQALENDLDRFGPEFLYEKIKECDPIYAAKISPNDRHKIVRALEIMALSHKRVSDFIKPSHTLINPSINYRCWFIHYSKEVLYQRIEMRCDQMLEKGFLEEVKKLEKQGLRANTCASQAIGYKQALDYFDSKQTKQDYEQFVDFFKRASKKYAKRQFTWFRKEPLFRWLDLEALSKESAREIILHDFENSL